MPAARTPNSASCSTNPPPASAKSGNDLRAQVPFDFYVGDRRDDRYYLNLDVNVSWVHELPAGFAYELGVNGGIRVGLNGHDNQGRNISGRIPGGVAGVFTGIRY